jgi:hypothetical protein
LFTCLIRGSVCFVSVGLGFEIGAYTLAKQVPYCLSHTSSLFCSGYFRDGVLRTTYPSWPQTTVLQISFSQVAGITDVSHRCPPEGSFN